MLRSFQIKKNAFRFGCCKRELQEYFSRGEGASLRSAGMTLSLDNRWLARRFPCFSGSGRLGRNFGSFTWKLKHSKFQRPCRGLSPGKGFAPRYAQHMACRDATRKAIFYSTVGGQIEAEMLGEIQENYFTKSSISRDHVDRFC